MEYTNNSRITTINDVENFATHFVKDCNISFHPDDDFADYINIENQDKIALYNRLNDECFDVCEGANADIYQIYYEIQYKHILNNR